MPTFPGTRDATTGTPARAASQITFAPPSIRELTTSRWLRASQASARECGTPPTHR
jgi:hypothetical protein